MRLDIAIFALSLCLGLVWSQFDITPISFTSLPGLELLLHTERELLLNLENYANALEAKVKVLRRAIADMRAENLKSVENAEKYLSNPLNSFALIRRMHTDWLQWKLYMESPVGKAEIVKTQNLCINLPSSKDIEQVTDAMYRLQLTYDLIPTEMAAGLLHGKQYNASLSSRDCFEIGQRLLSQDKIFYSSNWLYAAIQHYKENEVNAILGFDKLQIYDLYMETFLKQYRYDVALQVVNIALDYSPNNAKFLHAQSLIEHKMKISKEKPMEFTISEFDSHFPCCRGEFKKHLTRLHCRYNTTTHPFLKLAPLKMEELLMDPYMVLYHDVISDAEIAEIKEKTHLHLRPALVYDEHTKGFITHMGRTSHHSSFGDNASNTTVRIMQRITDLSGFDLQFSEVTSVVNYILAAQHRPHYDFFNVSKHNEIVQGVGDRIATVVFYLSEVDQGGSTVFPYLNVSVFPRKGSALMWYNLNNRGEIDARTLHASCPVIVGSKWIATKWIRESPQMFRRPCFKQ